MKRVLWRKRRYSWLLPTNVVQVAQALLQADSTDFQFRYQKEAWASLRVLEKILCQYLLPRSSKRVGRNATVVEKLDRHLKHLIEQTNHLLGLLMPEKRISLAAKNTLSSQKEASGLDDKVGETS